MDFRIPHKLPLRNLQGGTPSLALIFLAAALVYANTLPVPFALDDIPHIVENPAIRDFRNFCGPPSIPGETGSMLALSRIIGQFTFAINYAVHGLRPAGYHAVNILIHAANGMLFYAFAVLLLRAALPAAGERERNLSALFSSLFFVSHPVQTQAVTYIVQRFTILATLFYLLSVAAYLRGRLASGNGGAGGPRGLVRPKTAAQWYAVSFISCVCAMLTKEISFTLPLALAACEFLFFRDAFRTRLTRLAPFFLTMLIIPAIYLGAGGPPGGHAGFFEELVRKAGSEPVPPADYLATQLRVVVTYIRLLLLPVNQNLDYDYPVSHSFLDPPVVFSSLLLLALALLGLYAFLRSRRGEGLLRLASFGILWFFLTLSVESSFIPLADVIFEHRLYLPSAGFILASSSGVHLAWRRLRPRAPRAARALTATALAVLIVFSAAASARNAVWRNGVRLWEDVVEKSGGKARPRVILGQNYWQAGRVSEAVREYQAALSIDPGEPVAHYNLGLAYAGQGRAGEAVRAYREALRLRPDYRNAHKNLGNVYSNLGRLDEALREYEAEMRLYPLDADLHYNIGIVYGKSGRFREAVREFETALRLNPGHEEAKHNLKVTLYLMEQAKSRP